MAHCANWILLGLAASSLPIAVLQAQGSPRVLPPSHLSQEGTGATNVPFGRSTPMRAQLLYDGALFAGPVTITRLGMRADGGLTPGGKQVDCEIRMSTGSRSLVATSFEFARNRGGDEQVVYPRQVVALPGLAAPASPSPFHLHFDVAPFAYDPSLGPLVVEIAVFSQQPGAYGLDATFVCTSPQQAFGPPGCVPAGGQALVVDSATTQVLWGRPWVVRVLNAVPGTLTALVLGTRESGTWAGWALPFDLAALGAPGCFVSTDLAASMLQIAAGDGSASYTLSIPARPALQGLWLRFQASAVDPSANALGVVTSEARKVQVCGWERVGRVYASGTAASTGVLEIGVAPVLEVTFQ